MSANLQLTAIAGGLGSGKSVVSRILRAMGRDVYDCDLRARAIMERDPEIIARIADDVCREAVVDGVIDRRRLAQAVFSDDVLLRRLNSIVHGAVCSDIIRWGETHPGGFVETAILYESGVDRIVTEVWMVEAPREVRLRRGMLRDRAEADAIDARIRAQERFVAENPHHRVRTIVNDGIHPILPQILNLLANQTNLPR